MAAAPSPAVAKNDNVTHLQTDSAPGRSALTDARRSRGVVDDPDIILRLYRVRHMASRIHHEPELAKIKADETLRATSVKPVSTTGLARSAVEAGDAFENIRVDAIEDFEIEASVVSALRNPIVQLLDRASELGRFGSVQLRIDIPKGKGGVC